MAEDDVSAGFDLLHPGVQHWIWQQAWTGLRDIQEKSIPILLERNQDLVIAAATASGKTEAAFLPIVSRLASEERETGGGFDAVYASPLRALINDQFGRIESLCADLGIPVTKWHGDISASVKARARRSPGGILLTTPESLEAILVRRGGEASRLFAALSYVVVDELHAFLDQPRGRQLQSVLNRLELAAGHRTVRVGLSATLADMGEAASFLRPLEPTQVAIERSETVGGELRLQLRGYEEPIRPVAGAAAGGGGAPHGLQGDDEGAEPADVQEVRHDPGAVAEDAIAQHLFETLRGGRNLVFAGSRQRVESMTAALAAYTDAAGVPDEFLAHHGSLSREIREEAEYRLRDERRPSTILCTTTLELGIDVGPIESVAQLGAHHRVSGMRQRLGRSGRREGQPAVMRIYVREAEIDERTHPLDALRPQTVQVSAMVGLMLQRWNEPCVPGRLHLSTLVHQILALIAQHGGLTALQGWERLGQSSVFPELTVPLYSQVLRRMAHPDVRLIEQAPDGTILPGQEGERIIAGRDFYAVFMTPEEYKVVTDRGRSLGTIPVENPLVAGQLVIFGGRRWRVLEVDGMRREIVVAKAYGGKPPVFGGGPGTPHDRVVDEMKAVYMSQDTPIYFDSQARVFLEQGRTTFRNLGLDRASACHHSGQILLFPWVGSRSQTALTLALSERGLEATATGIAISLPASSYRDMCTTLVALADGVPPEGAVLARQVEDKVRDKFDHYLDEELLCLDWSSEHVDTSRVPEIARTLLASLPGEEP